MSTNEKAPIKGLKECKVYEPGTVVYVRTDVQTVKRLKVMGVSIMERGVVYIWGFGSYLSDRVFCTAEEAFSD